MGLLPSLNPKQIIESGLTDLHIGPDGETVKTCGLSGDRFHGTIDTWDRFEKEITDFRSNAKLQEAFGHCKDVAADADLMAITTTNAENALLELTQIGDERDLQGRFLENVTKRVQSVAKHVCSPKHVPDGTLQALRTLPLTDNVGVGSAKSVPERKRKQHEPDIVFKIPGSGNDQVVRVVGELKFPRTVNIGQFWDDIKTYRQGSMRQIFGQISRDMRENGCRFGFVSNYEETVFLKIVDQGNDGCALLYSTPISHGQRVVYGQTNGSLTEISVRLAMLYFLHRASYEDGSWAIDPSRIPIKQWILKGASGNDGQRAKPYESPMERLRDVKSKLTSLIMHPSYSRKDTNTHNATPGTLRNTGQSPDNPKDRTYIYPGTPSTVESHGFPDISPLSPGLGGLDFSKKRFVWTPKKLRSAFKPP